MSDLPGILSTVTLGPEDRLILIAPYSVEPGDLSAVDEVLRERFGDQVSVVAGFQGAIVLRAVKAEGSTVGQCGAEQPTTWQPPPDTVPCVYVSELCHLAYGHTGMHSDGEATWTGPSATQSAETTPDDTPAREGT